MKKEIDSERRIVHQLESVGLVFFKVQNHSYIKDLTKCIGVDFQRVWTT